MFRPARSIDIEQLFLSVKSSGAQLKGHGVSWEKQALISPLHLIYHIIRWFNYHIDIFSNYKQLYNWRCKEFFRNTCLMFLWFTNTFRNRVMLFNSLAMFPQRRWRISTRRWYIFVLFGKHADVQYGRMIMKGLLRDRLTKMIGMEVTNKLWTCY